MEWLNLHVSVLDSPEFIGAEPVERATWLMLMRYCIGQENSGIIEKSRQWKDRKWQQIVRVTQAETQASSDLWTWQGDDLHITHYPLEKEAVVKGARRGGKAKTQAKTQASRTNGQTGGRTKNPTETQPLTQANNPTETQAPPQGETQQKGREGNGKEGNGREVEESSSTPIEALAEQLINSHPRPSLRLDALQAAADCIRRHPDKFPEILEKTKTYAAAIATWPENERITYITSPAKFFAEDIWREHPDAWLSRRKARTDLAKQNTPPPIDIGNRKPKTLQPILATTATAAKDEF